MSSTDEIPDVEKINNIIAEVNALVKTYIYSSIDLVPIQAGDTIHFKIFGSLIKMYTVEEQVELDKMNPLNGGIILGKNDINVADLIPMIKMSTVLQQEPIDPAANNAFIRVLLKYDDPNVRVVDIEIIKREYLIDDITVMADHDAIAFSIPSTEVSELFTLLHNPTVNVTIEPIVRVNADEEEATRLAAEEAAKVVETARIKEEAARLAADEAAKAEAARLAAEEATKIKSAEAARLAAARLAAEEATKIKAAEAARVAAEETAKQKLVDDELAARLVQKRADEQKRAVETARLAAEQTARVAEDARVAKLAEAAKLAEDEREKEKEEAVKRVAEQDATRIKLEKGKNPLAHEVNRLNSIGPIGDTLGSLEKQVDELDEIVNYTKVSLPPPVGLDQSVVRSQSVDRSQPFSLLPPTPPAPEIKSKTQDTKSEIAEIKSEIAEILTRLYSLFTTPYNFNGDDFINSIGSLSDYNAAYRQQIKTDSTIMPLTLLQRATISAWNKAYTRSIRVEQDKQPDKMQAEGFTNDNKVYMQNGQPVDIRSTIKTAYTNFMKEFVSRLGLQPSLFDILNAKQEETDWFKRIVDTIRKVKDVKLFGNNRISQYYNCLIIVVITENTRRLLAPGTGNNIDEKIISYFHMLRRLIDYFEHTYTDRPYQPHYYDAVKDVALFLERGILNTHQLHNTHITRLLSAIRKPSTNAQYLDITGLSDDKTRLVGKYKPIVFDHITEFNKLDLSTLMYQIYDHHNPKSGLRGGSPTKKKKPTISSTNHRTKRHRRINRPNHTHNKLPRNIRRQSRKRRSIKIISGRILT